MTTTATHNAHDTTPGRALFVAFELSEKTWKLGFTTKPGGTGLGLYIVREMVVAHGGGVTVDSVEGQGTTFVLTFPAPR
jgi:signal transduction histidine kinase